MRAIDINPIVIARDVEPTFRGHLPCRGLRGAPLVYLRPVGLPAVGVGDVCFFLTMRCFNDAMFSNS